MYRIVHDGEDIAFIGNFDADGSSVLYKDASSCGNAMVHPTWYKVVGNEVVLRDNWEALRDAEEAARQAKQERISAIKSARDSSGLREITVEQAEAYISGKLDTTDLDAAGVVVNDAGTLPEAKSAIIAALIEIRKLIKNNEEVLTKMVPYILD